MNNRLKNGIAWSIIPQIILVKWAGSYPELVEAYYSNGLYPVISGFYRSILGWIPFSIGDVMYVILLFLLFRYLFLKRHNIRQKPKLFFRNTIMVLSVIYFTFHMLWGFNYYRQPIANNLGLNESHSQQELIALAEKLIKKTNDVQFYITSDTSKMVQIPYSKAEIFEKTVLSYQKLSIELPFLEYKAPSLKKSLLSTPLTYMGYGGYLNPFTNEAQVNYKIPNFRYPVVSAHEVGHQLGYSAENETNFIGYLATVGSDDIYFQYSAYAYALGYCLSDIKRKDETTFDLLYTGLHPGVKQNYQELANFWKEHENPLEPVFKSVFNVFLKVNDQADGIKSYSKVVALLVNYHKQHPL